MNYGQIMGYPQIVWMLFVFAVWSFATTLWIIRSHFRERKLRNDSETLGDLFAEAVRGISARITAIENREGNIDGKSSYLKPGRSKEGLTAKSTSKESQVRVRIETSASAESSQVGENSNS